MSPSSSQQTVPEDKALSSFESLPIEVHILILLEIPDFDCLKSILHSCKRCYAAYLDSPRRISHAVRDNQSPEHLRQLIDPVDALTAVRSKGLWFTFHKEEATSLLDTWSRREEPSFELDEPRGEEEAEISQLYAPFDFLLKDYAKVVSRPKWASPTEQHGKPPHICLSNTEKRRFLRGLCRLTIFCNIFGFREETLDSRSFTLDERNDWFYMYLNTHDFDPREYDPDPHVDLTEDLIPVYLFWDLMSPWECEEIGCVMSYFVQKYKDITEEITAEFLHLISLDQRRSPFLDTLPPGEHGLPRKFSGLLDVCDIEHRRLEQCTGQLISLGPQFLCRLLNADYRLRRDMVMANADCHYDYDCFMGHHSIWRSRRDRGSWSEYEIPVSEKSWSILPPHKKPNIAWQVAWVAPDTLMQQLQEFLWPIQEKRSEPENQTDMEWGYSIWDEERLEGWNTDWREHICKNK
ncbi:hypothetical protein PISL3812_03792 [Talaromyces islandicus]|uniref:F-box domain-containing protein n=1 Tax=Talaromyces islandicus TaxID=28573 RepID=A0A0U1LW32_TALIS|nr:hypothetical protein PISL3812_03792 [Talaromyces islandicus]